MTRVSFLGRRLPRGFDRRVVAVLPGGELPYDPREWHAAIVVVERGEIDLVVTDGSARRFRAGDVLCLAGLPLRTLRNPGAAVAVLAAVRRSSDEFPAPEPSERPEPTYQEPTP